ncbi:unnamed protein product [Clavelina lepadiformis]|uniref:NIDO domain-containing protein n=1 Tax=Clavelina lepadiformis TaxID=159417 RepID=A0ABP0G133_CLALP
MQYKMKKCVTRFDFFLFSLLFGTICVHLTTASVYEYNGGSILVDESVELDLGLTIPFLGGSLSSIWISSHGFISLTNQKDEKIIDNVVVSPFFSDKRFQLNSPNATYYQQTQTDSRLFEAISSNTQTLMVSDAYMPRYALVVTWQNMASPDDSSKVNTFQLVLSSDFERTFVSFNYDTLTWTSSDGIYASAGVEVYGSSSQQCFHNLPGSKTALLSQLKDTTTASRSLGKHILQISDVLLCSAKFDTDCGEWPKKNKTMSSGWGVFTPFFEFATEDDETKWNFFLQYKCKPGLRISPNKNSERIECVYISDYYEHSWETDISQCSDLNARKTFVSNVTVMQINDEPVTSINTEEIFDELRDTISPAIDKLFENIGVADVVHEIKNIISTTSESGETFLIVEFDSYVPADNKKLTNHSLARKIEVGVMQNNKINMVTFSKNNPLSVIETTDKCLQACLCSTNPDPEFCHGKTPKFIADACCGDCSGTPKSYSTSIKACCGGRILYDPFISTCCAGQIKRGDRCIPL